MRILIYLILIIFSCNLYAINSIVIDTVETINDHQIHVEVEFSETRACYKVKFDAPIKYPLSEVRHLSFAGIEYIRSNETKPFELLNPNEIFDLSYTQENNRIFSGVSCVTEEMSQNTYFVFNYVMEGTCPEIIHIPAQFVIRHYSD